MAAIYAVSTAVALAACVGDEPASTLTGSSDAGDAATEDVSTGDAASESAKAIVGDLTLYVGLLAKLDASASTPLDAGFAWIVKSAPTGSAIATASLQNATTSQASFVPDVPGDYVLSVTVTASGGGSSSALATVHAAPGKAFYALSHDAGPNKTATEVHYVRTDGTGDSPITCTTVASTAEVPMGDAISVASGIDWIEGDAGDNPRVAFGYADNLTDGGTVGYIATGTGASLCDGIHLVGHVDLVPGGLAPPEGIRLSPNGDRIAYLRFTNGSTQITTIGFDGNDQHAFEPMFYDGSAPIGGPTDYPPPRWIDETHIAWIEMHSTTSWQVMTATDVASPTPSVYMTCNASLFTPPIGNNQPDVFEFDMLADGSVLAAVGGAADASAAQNLAIFRPNPSTQKCELVRQLTNTSGRAVDFALSPDATKVAFLMNDSAGTSLYVAPIDGSTPPVRVGGQPDGGAIEGNGPRWAAGGAWLVWGESGEYINSPSLFGVIGIAANGGKVSPVAVPTNGSDIAYAAGNSCTIAQGRTSDEFTFGGALALSAFVAYGRRRRRPRGRTS